MSDLQQIRETVADILSRKDVHALRQLMRRWLTSDLAPHLSSLSEPLLATLVRIGPPDLAAAVFTYLDPEAQKRLLRLISQEQVALLLNAIPPDDRTAFLQEQPLDVAMQLLAMLTPENRAEAEALMAYPEDSVGRMMTLDYIAVRPEWTVDQALRHIRERGSDRETINIIYVIDAAGHLIDDIRIRRFLLAPPDQPVSDLTDGSIVRLVATDTREHALNLIRQLDRVALPVTDETGRLIGIVTVDDLLDVAEEEATEDIQKLGGSEALDEPYLLITLGKMIRKRASWLVILFIGEMFTATAMGFFEDEIAKAVVLALFIPLVISSGGNAGSQAATLVIRALALGEFRVRDWWRVMRRELIAGTALGAILGAIGFFRIAAWAQFSDIYGPHWLLIGSAVGASLIGIVLWGSVVGSMLPLLLKRLGFDPATSSAPFVATLVDVTGILIYFSVAWLFLDGVLL